MPKDPHAVALGRKGGKRGGPRRAQILSARRRSQIATEGAMARWHGKAGKRLKSKMHDEATSNARKKAEAK